MNYQKELDNKNYPFNEGDDYWTLESHRHDDNKICAVQSCWDDISEELFDEDRSKLYFETLENVLKYCTDRYEVVVVECFDSMFPDVETGDSFIFDEDRGKFKLESKYNL